MRILADLAEVKELQKAFLNKEDIHALTASQVFNVPIKKVDENLRRKAKTINFGIIYGISAFGLSKQLKIQRKDAQQFISDYFSRFPGIREYMDSTIEFARTKIAGYKCPKSIDFIKELPRNPGGKILRRELRVPYWKGRDRNVS